MEHSDNKIKILIVDDHPAGLTKDISWPYTSERIPKMDPQLAEFFDFRWLATARECREFRDLSWVIGEHDPHLLSNAGWVPEILVLDYALTQDDRTVSQRVQDDSEWLERLSPLPALRKCYAAVGCDDSIPRDDCPVTPQAGTEFWGCFIGGLLLSTFSNHPMAPITITRYNQQTINQKSADAAFFQWLLGYQSSGFLEARGGSSPTWWEIVCHQDDNDESYPSGVGRLRARIESQAKRGLIILHLDDLLALANHREHPLVSFTSRYGTRRLPVQGLFIDFPKGKEREHKAQDWASTLVNDALSYLESDSMPKVYVPTVSKIEEGRKLAKALLDQWEDIGGVVRRLEFSRYLAQPRDARGKPPFDLTPEEEQALQKYKQKAVNLFGTGVGDIRKLAGDHIAKRWAILFVATRLACIAWKMRSLRPDYNLSADDVYLALFPNSEVVPYYLHTRNRDVTQVTQTFNRLEIPIHIPDVIEGKEWGANSRGILPFERRVLRMFAASQGCVGWQWADDPAIKGHALRNILLGAEEKTAASEEQSHE